MKARTMTESSVFGMNERVGLHAISRLLKDLRSGDYHAESKARSELYLLAEKVWKLDEVGEAAIPHLLKTLCAKDKTVRVSAIWGLNWLAQNRLDNPELSAQSVAALTEMLRNDSDEDTRLSVVHALKWFRDAHATSVLVDCLNDENKSLAIEAAKALGWARDVNAVPGLLDALANSTDMLVRHRIILALGQIRDTRAMPALIALFRNGDSLRRYAVSSLGEIGDKRATPILLEALHNDPSGEVRAEAIHGLARLKDSRAVPGLIEVLKRGSYAAAYALAEIGDESALPALLEAIDNAPEGQAGMPAIDALRHVTSPKKAATLLIEMLLHHKADYVRGFAARALGYLANSVDDTVLRDHIVSNLIASLSDMGISYHYMGHVCGEAARSLRFIGTPEALAAFERWRLASES
jgi:HEAT repeat protein